MELNLLLEKVIDRPTQTPLCGFAVAACEPINCSDEHIFALSDFPDLYDIIGAVL